VRSHTKLTGGGVPDVWQIRRDIAEPLDSRDEIGQVQPSVQGHLVIQPELAARAAHVEW
jgi:hypothetical protein